MLSPSLNLGTATTPSPAASSASSGCAASASPPSHRAIAPIDTSSPIDGAAIARMEGQGGRTPLVIEAEEADLYSKIMQRHALAKQGRRRRTSSEGSNSIASATSKLKAMSKEGLATVGGSKKQLTVQVEGAKSKGAARVPLKGEWLPAAIFIFLSHVLVALYFSSYLFVMVARTRDTSRAGVWNVSGAMIAMTLVSAWLNLLGITAGYHRLWSHNSYRASTGLRVFLAIIGLMSFQGSARWWVLKHRLHHRFTDTESDPYDSTKGLWFSHIGWLFEAPPYCSKVSLISMRDVDSDPVAAFQKRHLLLGYLLFGLGLPGMLGLLAPEASFWLGALWVGFVGRFLSWHAIWTINSLSHWQGVKEFSKASSAVYVAVVNLIQNGEGHHNYHHCFPLDYRHGHRWYEWDPTKWCIQLWCACGVASDAQTVARNEVLQAQTQVLESDAASTRLQAQWPRPLDELPKMSVAEFEELAKETKGEKIILRYGSDVLDCTSFSSHAGGQALLRAYHGKDMTAAFTGGVNLHTQAAHNLAIMMRIAVILEDE